MNWKNRIVRHGEERPDQLLANPNNWRIHPRGQQEALEGVLEEVGWVQNIIVNERTGHVVDGHMRVAAAISAGADSVPVVYVDLSEQEEKLILATLDPISAMAVTDQGKLDDLLGEVKTGMVQVEDLLKSLSSFDEDWVSEVSTDSDKNGDDFSDDKDSIYAYREDAIFSSSNKWGIPDIREDMLSDMTPAGVWAGGREDFDPPSLFIWSKTYGRDFNPSCAFENMIAFYEEDFRFEAIWNRAVEMIDRLKSQNWGAVVMPDFSLWRDSPLTIQLFNLYRSRWCARYWQEAGLKIIPSLNWSDERSYEWAWCGLPKGAPIISVQCRTTRSKKGKEFFIHGLIDGIEKLEPKKVMIYGGAEHKKWIAPLVPGGPEYIWLSSWSNLRTERRK